MLASHKDNYIWSYPLSVYINYLPQTLINIHAHDPTVYKYISNNIDGQSLATDLSPEQDKTVQWGETSL